MNNTKNIDAFFMAALTIFIIVSVVVLTKIHFKLLEKKAANIEVVK